MKQIFERVFCAFFFLIFFHTTCFAREFDIEECNTATLHFEMIKSSDGKDGHYYYLTGICGQISFNLRAYYWIEADAYREVFTHSTFGKSYLFGWECANSPVLYENFCALTIPMDSTSVVHRKYRSPLARKILTGEQLAELDSQLEAVMQSRLAALPRDKTMTIPKGSALKAVDPKTGRSSTDLGDSSGFRVYSPVEGEQYTIAPPFTVH
ncbi:MAG: hypothetical protein HKO99_01875, partial [Xanthomonadales bacterium]|nr:hypothetical protein [Xanthomonadales bacterium]